MRWSIALVIFMSSEVIAQTICELAQSRFFGETCSGLTGIEWNYPNNTEVKLTLFSSERDRLSCGHVRELRQHANAILSDKSGVGRGMTPTSAANWKKEAEFRIAIIRMFQDYLPSRFFRRSQFLEISFEHPEGKRSVDERVVVLFNGGMSEYSAAALRSDSRDGRLTVGFLTNSAELCFRNHVHIVVYQDILQKGNFLRYRKPLVSRALVISYEKLEELETIAELYRDRGTDNDD